MYTTKNNTKQPSLENIKMGMTEAEVISEIGKPTLKNSDYTFASYHYNHLKTPIVRKLTYAVYLRNIDGTTVSSVEHKAKKNKRSKVTGVSCIAIYSFNKLISLNKIEDRDDLNDLNLFEESALYPLD